MLTVVCCGDTSKIQSARLDAELSLPSGRPASMACICGSRRLAEMVRRKSSWTSGVRFLRCWRKCHGFGRPFLMQAICLTRC
jgi:formate dehydrogenase maturation protein FdhE